VVSLAIAGARGHDHRGTAEALGPTGMGALNCAPGKALT
jgi:hypothetical protein